VGLEPVAILMRDIDSGARALVNGSVREREQQAESAIGHWRGQSDLIARLEAAPLRPVMQTAPSAISTRSSPARTVGTLSSAVKTNRASIGSLANGVGERARVALSGA
jgi:hypothetical protein